MIPWSASNALPLLFLLIFTPTAVWPQSNLERIKAEHQTIGSRLQKHIVDNWWIDEAPESPGLLARQWVLEGEWIAAWLNEHSSQDVRAAINALVAEDEKEDAKSTPSEPASKYEQEDAKSVANEPAREEETEYLQLGQDAFLVVAPNDIGNVFVVASMNGHFRLVWSTAQVQTARGEQAEVLAAWRPENARNGGRGPYYAASGSAGSVIPRIGRLPPDGTGHPRFYINGTYAQSAGGTVGAQISVWLWNGKNAEPLVAKDYALMIDQAVGTRVEGNLLKVQEKKFFRSFFSCGMCEERQTDWTIRLTPDGVEDLGEKSVVPELDAVDELFHRVICHESAGDVADPGVIELAEQIVEEARGEHSEENWKEFPTLGMIGEWKTQQKGDSKVLCLSLDDAGTNLFTLRPVGQGFFVTEMKQIDESCKGRN